MNKRTREVLELAKNLLAHHANGGDWEAQQSQRVIDQINEVLKEPVRKESYVRELIDGKWVSAARGSIEAKGENNENY